ncbi:UNVERIFIED_CONTAM: hypothetical protein Slati_3631900 [Sesamum latifolium]|uniref:Bifunctional inhibitor/plant lipid transfer protein/seed storage helical domain-containing protein n=1 Tax=Sesamum latifolium TaxID=2727402 RepID=A0AAW2U1M1_9LAMI
MGSGSKLGEGGPSGSAQQALPTPTECNKERRLGFKACRRTIIYGWRPSGKCCGRIRATHPECVCPLITPKVASVINVERAIKIIEGCGGKSPTSSSVEVSPRREIMHNAR